MMAGTGVLCGGGQWGGDWKEEEEARNGMEDQGGEVGL